MMAKETTRQNMPDSKKAEYKQLCQRLHDEAVLADSEFYRDPRTGDLVSTDVRLRRLKKCCKSGCRHCPYGFKKRK
jgi:hypothetical protein